jgi:amidohydrolase
VANVIPYTAMIASDTLHDAVMAQNATMIATRRDLHQHPELSFEETRTAQIIADRLRGLDVEVREHIGNTGVVGVLHGGAAGTNARTLMIRADIDALPIQEANETDFRSQEPGKMHACGHDGHVAIGLGVAAVLAGMRDSLPGNVVFAFQPAEERASGAEAMIREGALSDPSVDGVIGLHLWNQLPVGTVGVRPGPIFASADEIILTVRGRGGHGAMPELNVDPIVAAAQIVTALQTLVSREISPFHPAVVTIGEIHGGTAFNVIADEVRLRGTVRTHDEADRTHLLRRIGELASEVAQGMRASCTLSGDVAIPVCFSDANMAALVHHAAATTVGEDHVTADCIQTVGDDMALFLNAVPGCYFLVGAGDMTDGIPAPHHSAHFAIHEGSLPIGAEVLARAALDYLAG